MNRSESRRQFLRAAAATASASAVSCRRSPSPWRFFTAAEAETVAAICEQIVPADRDPGAAWAGVVNFIDRQLTRRYRQYQQTYRAGLAAVDETALRLHGERFVRIAAGQQQKLLAKLEKNGAPRELWGHIEPREFFNTVLNHTMQGFYGNPRHGGNRDAVSWRMLGVPEPPVRGRQQYGSRQAGA